MIVEMNAAPLKSIESVTDQQIDELIGKVVDNSASPDEKTRLEQLLQQRARLMQPRIKVIRPSARRRTA